MPGKVKLRTIGIGAGSVPVTSFSDTLIGADRAPYIGNNWCLVGSQSTAVSWATMAAYVNIGGSGFAFGDGVSGNNNATNVNAFPAPVDFNAIRAKSLTGGIFSQMKLVSRPIAGTNGAVGPMVGANPGDSTGYGLQLNSTNTNTVLFRMNGNGTFTSLNANVFTNSLGDVIRLELTISGSNCTLKSYQNGTLRDTTVDNSGLGPTSGGLFGMILYGMFNGQIVVSNYAGGTL